MWHKGVRHMSQALWKMIDSAAIWATKYFDDGNEQTKMMLHLFAIYCNPLNYQILFIMMKL